MKKIAENPAEVRAAALRELTILARLRNLVSIVERETERMPILEDIMDHEIIGRERKRGQRAMIHLLIEGASDQFRHPQESVLKRSARRSSKL